MNLSVVRKYKSADLFGFSLDSNGLKKYRPILGATVNRKGVLDVDTVKGCRLGMQKYPTGGCYGECYALKTATQYGFDFSVSVSRKPTPRALCDVYTTVRAHSASWYRIGTAGDPCHDWENTIRVCSELGNTGKIPVIITKRVTGCAAVCAIRVDPLVSRFYWRVYV